MQVLSDGLAQSVLEFLAVMVQTILFTSSVYPRGMFQKQAKYGIPVFLCRHPMVVDYLRDALFAPCVIKWIQEGLVERVVVVVEEEDEQGATVVVARYVMDLTVGGRDGNDGSTLWVPDADAMEYLEQVVFRAHIAKLLVEKVGNEGVGHGAWTSSGPLCSVVGYTVL